MEEGSLYTIMEASDITGISEAALIRLAMLKEINTSRVGRSIRITGEELERLLSVVIGASKENKSFDLPDIKNKPVIFTAEEIAGILNLSVDNILLLLKSGELKGFKIRQGRSSWRVPEKYLNEFIENRVTRTRIEENIK
jgi:excisionase family DNA binding protein